MTALAPAIIRQENSGMKAPVLSITYCTQCNWLLRAAWLAQEALSTFGTDLGAVSMCPGTGGVFVIRVDDTLIWDRSQDGGFPEAKVLKQRIRDVIDPDRNLGHADRTIAGAIKTAAGSGKLQPE